MSDDKLMLVRSYSPEKDKISETILDKVRSSSLNSKQTTSLASFDNAYFKNDDNSVILMNIKREIGRAHV